MQPLIARRDVPGQAPDPRPQRLDPAPSRLAYRMERLWLRPAFRKLCRVGLPVMALVLFAGIWASNPDNIRGVTDWASEMRRSIEGRPEFQVNVVGIEGASPVLADEIRLILGINLPTSSFDLDLDRLRDRIVALPGVADAELRVRSGGYLAVNVTEREPAMIWQTRGGAVLIDEGGLFVAALQDRPYTEALPQVAGEGADLAAGEAMAILGLAAGLDHPVRGLVRVGERRWDVVLDDGRRILLPSHDAVAEFERFIALNAADEILARDVLRVDMRNPDRVSVQLSPRALDELRRARGLIEFEEDAG